jgi:hypothetical protein
MLNQNRSETYKRSAEVEKILGELSDIMSVSSSQKENALEESQHPNVYIVGCARSGTTVLHQLLVKALDFCYPTNLLSRFYASPYAGALIQKLMVDLDDKEELLGGFREFGLESKLGKTKGPLSPHEFWYFWRSHFAVNELGYIDSPTDAQINTFLKGLNSIKVVFDKPLILKGMIANNALAELVQANSQDKVIFMKRKLATNALSLLNARKDFYEDINQWYSFKIADKIDINANNPYEQVVLQVEYTNRLVEEELQKLPQEKVYWIDYEDVSDNFGIFMNKISSDLKVGKKAVDLPQIKESKPLENDKNWLEINRAIEGLKTKVDFRYL